jgi:hypothetical protein
MKDNSKQNMQVILKLTKCYVENQKDSTPFDSEAFFESKIDLFSKIKEEKSNEKKNVKKDEKKDENVIKLKNCENNENVHKKIDNSFEKKNEIEKENSLNFQTIFEIGIYLLKNKVSEESINKIVDKYNVENFKMITSSELGKDLQIGSLFDKLLICDLVEKLKCKNK